MVAILVYGVVIIGNSVYFAIAGGGCHVDDLGALLDVELEQEEWI